MGAEPPAEAKPPLDNVSRTSLLEAKVAKNLGSCWRIDTKEGAEVACLERLLGQYLLLVSVAGLVVRWARLLGCRGARFGVGSGIKYVDKVRTPWMERSVANFTLDRIRSRHVFIQLWIWVAVEMVRKVPRASGVSPMNASESTARTKSCLVWSNFNSVQRRRCLD